MSTADEKKPVAIRVRAGDHSLQGRRSNQEDRENCIPYPKFNKTMKIEDDVFRSWFAVYDGHGGHVCAEYCKRNVYVNFAKNENFGSDNEKALKEAILKTDSDFGKAAAERNLSSSSGACAIICYIENRTAFFANLGDSRAVLCRGGRAIDMSTDHKPDRPDEKARIEKAGGFVGRTEAEKDKSALWKMCMCVANGPQRVFPGGLAVCRSIGDVGHKNGKYSEGLIIADAETSQVELDEDLDEFIVLACDGVWDVMKSQEAIDIVRKYLKKTKDPSSAAEALCETALEKGSMDNISSCVIKLSRRPNDNDGATRKKTTQEEATNDTADKPASAGATKDDAGSEEAN